MNAAQMFHMAMGFFRKVEATVPLTTNAPVVKHKKVRKIGYGEAIRAVYAAKRKDVLDAKRIAAQ
jgi:hypothetical protein